MQNEEPRPDWDAALWSNDHARLQRLLNEEAPPVACFQLERHIRQLYIMTSLQPGRIDPEHATARIQQLSAVLPALRSRIGGWLEQRAYDLSVLQWIRRNAALSVVLGAGVTIAAGGPSWPALVQKLLKHALSTGHETLVYERTEKGAKARVDHVERLGPVEAAEARALLAAIEAGSSDTELLMRGAQMCADLYGEHLFQRVTMALYPGGTRAPSAIHRSIAKLARAQTVPGLGATPGWVSIVNYNFDSLMNDALEAERVPYTVALMRNRKIYRATLKGDPNPDMSLPILHLHGFTPRQPFFDLRGVDFVFSTQQFKKLYEADEPTIIKHAINRFISHPAYVAVYVGCSFTDEAMNGALREASRRFPGRFHYALLQLPDRLRNVDDPEHVDRVSSRYTGMGVRPVWFRDFDEIPGLIDRLA